MDTRFGDQLIALTLTALSLIIAIVMVGLMVQHGALLVSEYFGAGLLAFAALRFTLGHAVKPRATAVPADDPED